MHHATRCPNRPARFDLSFRAGYRASVQACRRAFLPSMMAALLLGGCASHGPANTLYDFGPPPDGAAAAPATLTANLPAVVVTDATGASALDSQVMYYRLNYADPLQARPYANNHWNSSPLQMVTQRVKSRFAQAGVKVLAVTDAAIGLPLLRIEIDDFSHSFDSVNANYGLLVVRASVFQGHKLVDQKTFGRKTMSTSADAAGGSRALAGSTDAVAADMLAWLAALPWQK